MTTQEIVVVQMQFLPIHKNEAANCGLARMSKHCTSYHCPEIILRGQLLPLLQSPGRVHHPVR